MKLKINRWTFDVTNKDWVLDNGACFQCMTLKHYSRTASWSKHFQETTIMSKKQFNELVKEGKLIDYSKEFFKKYPNRFVGSGCKIWKFNIEVEDESVCD